MLLNVLGCTRTTLAQRTSSSPFFSKGALPGSGSETLEICAVTGIDDCNYSP
jgi:hypothetical protein